MDAERIKEIPALCMLVNAVMGLNAKQPAYQNLIESGNCLYSYGDDSLQSSRFGPTPF
jgi:S-adenosylmethionine:tRNA-ribosyltransferase-isomerase (queuine synthetase)